MCVCVCVCVCVCGFCIVWMCEAYVIMWYEHYDYTAVFHNLKLAIFTWQACEPAKQEAGFVSSSSIKPIVLL